jgi:hypothetical protein
VARADQRARRAHRTASGPRRRNGDRGAEGILPVLARCAREVEAVAQRGRLTASDRTKFQVVAVLARQERVRVRAEVRNDATRSTMLKRLDGIALILARTGTHDTSLLALLDEDAVLTDAARALMRRLLEDAGLEAAHVEAPAEEPPAPPVTERQVMPQAVVSRQLANPFLAPDFSAARPSEPKTRRLANWELLGPLFRSFERAAEGASSCMDLPDPASQFIRTSHELMPHQGRLVAAAAAGHRTFLLADEPGLGKTAQALLAARAANAYPLLVVVPNVVKTNWAREAALWTPDRPATVIHGDGDTMDGFADIVVVNYEVLDRHVGWIGELGFRGMVIDEAHFIKNKTSQRSRNVLECSERIRSRVPRPLLMALTGTPLINDIEDFRAIWQFLGWIDDTKPLTDLMCTLEQTGLAPADPGFYPAARQCVVDLGIVRRRKVDVAADIPARRVADLPVELEDRAGRSIREAEQQLARRLVERYESALATRRSGPADQGDGIDHDLVRRIATRERKEATQAEGGDSVFAVMRRIGQAKAGLAADYAVQLARSTGKVVFFAKHVDVMDAAEDAFGKAGIRFSSIRGDQTRTVRQREIDAFVNDPDVSIAVCSLTAAGVGINLQVASNIVLAELSWTDAEQTQAIDRCHRIGQSEPVTAWRVIAAQTVDARIAELIDRKAGLAARALDGAGDELPSAADIQLEALVALLTDALTAPR